jgi:predicted nucleic acid-binding protein
MRIFLDTNIILDVLAKREPFYIDSAKVLTLVNENIVQGFISAITINNIYYILNRLKNRETAKNFTTEILNYFEVIPLTKTILEHANRLDVNNFEDAIQYISAIDCQCDFFITRNLKYYPENKTNEIKIIAPSDLIKLLP